MFQSSRKPPDPERRQCSALRSDTCQRDFHMMELTRASKFGDAADMFSYFKLDCTCAVTPRACMYMCSIHGCMFLGNALVQPAAFIPTRMQACRNTCVHLDSFVHTHSCPHVERERERERESNSSSQAHICTSKLGHNGDQCERT